jgi:micrococcal nuclease
MAGLLHAQELSFSGKVVGVADGDTIVVLKVAGDTKTPIKVRLHGIDCPEKAQAFGQKAKQFTSQMVYGKKVRVEVKDTDRYGRTVGEVFIGTDSLNRKLVQNGLAWWYRRYAPHDGELGALEKDARSNRRGLWADAAPIPPWDFRRKGRGQ